MKASRSHHFKATSVLAFWQFQLLMLETVQRRLTIGSSWIRFGDVSLRVTVLLCGLIHMIVSSQCDAVIDFLFFERMLLEVMVGAYSISINS